MIYLIKFQPQFPLDKHTKKKKKKIDYWCDNKYHEP